MTSKSLAPDGRPIVYIRVSSDKQDTERQENAVPELAARDFPHAEPIIIRDDGISAFKNSIFERPGGSELVRLVERHRIPAIYADAQDRLSRGGPREWLPFAAICHEHGTRIITLAAGEIDTSEDAEFVASAFSWLARKESRDKSHRSTSAARARAEAGFWVGHKPPVGLTTAPAPDNPKHKILLTTDDFPKVELAFELVDSGWSISDTAREVGLPLTTLSGRVLRNRAYIGETQHKGEWLPAKWPAFVDPARFERVQRVLSRNREAKGRHSLHHPFGPILRCHCGQRLVHRHGRGPYVYYRCKNSCGIGVSAENLEATLCAYLSVVPAWIREALDSGEWRKLDLRERQADDAERKLIEKDAELAALVRIAAKGGAQGKHAEQEADVLSAEVEQLREEYQRLSRDAATVRGDLERLEDFLRFGADADEPLDTRIIWWWRHAEVGTKRGTFDSLFEKIEVGSDYLALTFRRGFPPTPIRLPFASHKRDAISPALRELGFGIERPAEGETPLVGNSSSLPSARRIQRWHARRPSVRSIGSSASSALVRGSSRPARSTATGLRGGCGLNTRVARDMPCCG